MSLVAAEAHAEWRRLHEDLQPIALAPKSAWPDRFPVRR